MTMIATFLTHRLTALPRATLGALLSGILEADRRYRDRRHVDALPEDRLSDVGLWRAPEHLIRNWP